MVEETINEINNLGFNFEYVPMKGAFGRIVKIYRQPNNNFEISFHIPNDRSFRIDSYFEKRKIFEVKEPQLEDFKVFEPYLNKEKSFDIIKKSLGYDGVEEVVATVYDESEIKPAMLKEFLKYVKGLI